MSNKILVIGAVNIDIFTNTDKPYTLEDSNLANISLGFGGVGGNIATNLNTLGLNVSFITAFSNDLLGIFLKNHYHKSGIETIESLNSKSKNSSVYLGIMDQDKDLFLGLNDMAIINDLNIDFLTQKQQYIESFEYIVIDNNLNQETLNYLLTTYNHKTIMMDAVSAKKVIKLKGLLNNISVLKVNQIELNVLSQETDIKLQIKSLLNQGLKEIIVTNKDKPVYYGKEDVIKVFTTYNCDNIVNATGAGDAFISGYAYGVVNKMDLNNRIDQAMKLANQTLQVKTSTIEKVN